MIGILVELAISWLIIWLVERKDLGVLGFRPTTSRLKGFALFFLIATFVAVFEIALRVIFFKEHYLLNPKISLRLLAEGSWWNVKSVLYEELIFRGVLLYILLRRFGATAGIVVSAVAFGIYHWFSYNVFGQVVPMIYVFVVTGTMGLILAYSYKKTLSLYIAIGFHLGWNLVRGFVFSQGSIGNGVFIRAKNQPEVTVSYFVYYLVTLLPLITLFLVSWLVLRRWKQVDLAVSP